MSLIQEVPGELREFARVFDKICYRHGDYGSVFSDFVSYLTAGLLVEGDKKLADSLKGKYGNDYKYFNELVIEIIKVYHVKMWDDRWYDGFGIFYETIKSKYKSSVLGQYFTPPEICDLMASISNPQGESVMDCCSGSGRMLLAAKIINPGIKCFAADVDPVCAKMSAINLAFHGCQGEVSCMDSLRMDWRFGYQINYYHAYGAPPVPHLLPILQWEKSAFYLKPIAQKEPEKVNKKGQYSLF